MKKKWNQKQFNNIKNINKIIWTFLKIWVLLVKNLEKENMDKYHKKKVMKNHQIRNQKK